MMTEKSVYVSILFCLLFMSFVSYFPINSYIGVEFSFQTDNNENLGPKSSTEGDLVWNSSWGGAYNDYGYGVWGDENYLYTTGGSNSFEAINRYNQYLLCWYKNSTLRWNSSFSFPFWSEMGINIWGDEEYLYTVGTTVEYPHMNSDTNLRVIKWDKNGNQLWNQSWGHERYEEQGYDLWGDETSIYTVGKRNYLGLDEDLYLVRWDKNGTELWNYTWWDDSAYSYGYGIWGDENCIYTVGTIRYTNPYKTNIIVHKWWKAGYLIWSRIWNDLDENSEGYGIWGDTENLYVIGNRWSDWTSNICFIKWDKNGNQVFNSTYWPDDYSETIVRMWGNSAYLYTTGQRKSKSIFDSNNYNMSIFQWDKQNGTPRLSCTWGGEADEVGLGIWGDENYLYSVGYTESLGSGARDLFLLKWDFSIPIITTTSTSEISIISTTLTSQVTKIGVYPRGAFALLGSLCIIILLKTQNRKMKNEA